MFIRMCGQLLLVKSRCGKRKFPRRLCCISQNEKSVVIGHLPRKISPIASLFLVKDGMILC